MTIENILSSGVSHIQHAGPLMPWLIRNPRFKQVAKLGAVLGIACLGYQVYSNYSVPQTILERQRADPAVQGAPEALLQRATARAISPSLLIEEAGADPAVQEAPEALLQRAITRATSPCLLIEEAGADPAVQEAPETSLQKANLIVITNLKMCRAILQNNERQVRCLLKEGANPNFMRKGQRVIELAFDSQSWLAAKVLIDNGAFLTEGDINRIQKYLESKKVGKDNLKYFMTPFPNPLVIETLLDGQFQPLVKVISSISLENIKSIALFFVADEPPGEHYGAVVSEYTEPMRKDYCDLAKEGISVNRVRVNDKDQFVLVLEKIRRIFPPNIHITSSTFTCHAWKTVMQIGSNSLLTTKEIGIMKAIGQFMKPSGSIILNGCATASGPENLAEIFSHNAPESFVFGTTNSASDICFLSVSLPQFAPRVIPIFREKGHFKIATKAYKQGQGILDIAKSSGDKFPQQAFQQFMLRAMIQDEQQRASRA